MFDLGQVADWAFVFIDIEAGLFFEPLVDTDLMEMMVTVELPQAVAWLKWRVAEDALQIKFVESPLLLLLWST